MPEAILTSLPETLNSEPGSSPSVEVYAVYGVEPEVQAYAMAKYSRSALSMKESLKEISRQKAEKFLNTFYFQYGHRSIADLAHIALAVERLSILAAIAVADEQRWDGQERSTRYQDFNKSGYFTPDFGGNRQARNLYRQTIANLFAEYESLTQKVFDYLCGVKAKPPEMKQEAYDRTMRARAFDISRYLLPLATNTSLGEIVNARTLESQVSHLLSHTHKEARSLGELLKQAATSPAYNANQDSLSRLIDQIRSISPPLADQAEQDLLREVRVAPTLVKYADPNAYEIETRRELRQVAAELMGETPIAPAPIVDSLDEDPLEIELATTLLYEHCHYPYRQIREALRSSGAKRLQEIIDVGLRHRGKHDEMLRAFRAGQQFRFDILMDIGGFRDMHRHRRCIQIGQEFTTKHGYDTPEELGPAGALANYDAAMQQAARVVEELSQRDVAESQEDAQYAIPLAFRKRTLFKMDFAEVVYISELRTKVPGHMSYRKVSYAMFEAIARKHPELKQYFRVTDVNEPVDLLDR
jgi:thymidylate synthase ThyX